MISIGPGIGKIRILIGRQFRVLYVVEFPETIYVLHAFELTRVMQARGLTQAAAAKLLGVTQPRVSDLMRGKIERFSIDTLIAMFAQAGVGVTVKVRRRKRAA